MKNLLIKASGITNPVWRGYNSGVGRSTQLLLEALAKEQNLPFCLHYYANGISSLGYKNHLPFKYSAFPIPEKWGCKKTNLEPFFRTYFFKYDLLHIPHNLDKIYPKEKYVVTLHDVIAYDMAMQMGNEKEMRRWKEMARNAVGIMTCSNFSKNEIVNKLSIDDKKVTVAYWGISREKFYVADQNIVKSKLKKLGIDFPYFVSVSCSHPRKNIRTLIKAFKHFCKQTPNHRLILVWGNPPSDILEMCSKEVVEKRIIFLNYVSDDDLLALYNGATCTMFPTRSEGFGFPILESFACGTPIMTCRNTCLPEIGQNVAIYVGEDNEDEMIDVMKMFEYGKYDMSNFQVQSKLLLERFSWSNTAKAYIDFYSKYI